MNDGRSPHSIDSAWRESLDRSLETGEAPVYAVDASAGGLTGMNAVVALARFDAQRRDLTMPYVAMGGTSPRWLAALWHVRPDSAPPRTPPVATTYTAPDPATHLAALTTWDTRHSVFYHRPANLPPWVQPDAAPEANPAAPDRWNTSPLVRFSIVEGRDGWLAWAGVVTAIALLLIAVLA